VARMGAPVWPGGQNLRIRNRGFGTGDAWFTRDSGLGVGVRDFGLEVEGRLLGPLTRVRYRETARDDTETKPP